LAENYRVYAIDLLGFGASDKPANVEYGPELWADLVCDFAEEFAHEGAVLLGNSIGSLTVLSAAAKAGSELFKYVEYYDFAGFHDDMKPGWDRAEGAVVELVGVDLANH
jgi:pimeloyl-ACP methyl ester carboxylesterase